MNTGHGIAGALVGSAVAAQREAGSQHRQKHLDELAESIRHAIMRTENATARVRDVADAIYGQRPPEPVNAGNQSVTEPEQCAWATLQMLMTSLDLAQNRLDDEIARVRQLA